MRLAFEAVGGRCVFSSEIDRFARQTYEANFGEEPSGDITKLAADDVPAHDILLAGFPCQPFSIAGVSKYASLGRQHGFRDKTKGTLFFHILRLLESHRPKAFLLENVKNLKSHDRGRTWEVIRGALEDLGYGVHATVLDARAVVPQHRERVYIVGFREPATLFSWPDLGSEGPKLEEILDPQVDGRYTLSDHLWKYLQDYSAKHRSRGNGFGFGLADLKGVSRTLSARYYKDGSEILIPNKVGNPRRLTPRECCRLMGFPERFKIPVSDTQAYRQFGNAVVVPLVEAVAGSVVKAPATPSSWRRKAPFQMASVQ